MTVTINGTTGIAGVDGSAGTPAVQGGDSNTGVFFPAADTVAIATGGTEAMRVTSSQNVGIGTASPAARLQVAGAFRQSGATVPYEWTVNAAANDYLKLNAVGFADNLLVANSAGNVGIGTISPGVRLSIAGPSTAYQLALATNSSTNGFVLGSPSADTLAFASWAGTERARIDSSGNFVVGTTDTLPADNNVAGICLSTTYKGLIECSRDGGEALQVNRKSSDGNLVLFRQDGTTEGSISVSGTTVSYNGGHLSRWAQTTGPKDDTLVKGTVLSNLDEMNQYTDADGNPVPNEQLNKVKVSDVDGDPNVAGVFVNWSHDEAHDVDEINMAMTGDMIIRIAQGVTVQRGDLLMSAGDGTAKPQGDDIIRSKTVAKVTSTHVTCTYADGSYCVPCVLMAC